MTGSSTNAETLPAALTTWVTELVGPCTVVPHAGGGPTRNRLYAVTAGRARFFLKVYHERWRHGAEVYAYRHWLAVGGECFPSLIGSWQSDEGCAILNTALSGRPLEGAALPEEQVQAVWHAAGRLAARVHNQQSTWGRLYSLPGPAGWKACPTSFFRAELDAVVAAARQRQVLTADDERLVAWAERHVDAFADEQPRPIDRDFTPGNWLVDDDGRFVGAVDFEDMRWGLRIEAFGHLWLKFTPDHPGREAAFFAGYGIDPHAVCPVQVRLVCIRQALSSLVLGACRGSVRHSAMARRLLRLLACNSAPLRL